MLLARISTFNVVVQIMNHTDINRQLAFFGNQPFLKDLLLVINIKKLSSKS